MQPLRIALTKGRLEKDTIKLFQKIGYDCDAVINKGRKLILPIGNGEIEVVLAKAADVITYVENGVCDLGVVGKDTLADVNLHLPHKRARIFIPATRQLPLPQSTLMLQEHFLKKKIWMLGLSKLKVLLSLVH